ncbi:MAG: thioesterase family protein [Cyclobacteriaceae bacterium]|nr:thioesterase family protein [Cyclobacteriaceae bacterium]
MSRIKIDLPEKHLFTTQLAIRISDINYGKHVGNDSVLTLMHEARLQWLISLGYKDETDLAKDTGIIVADAAIVYKNESFYGDTLTIQLYLGEQHKYGFDLYYLLLNGEKEIARGKTGIIMYNYNVKKVTSIPESMLVYFRD